MGTLLSSPSKLKHPFISICEGSGFVLLLEKNILKHKTRIAKSHKDQASGKIQSTWVEWPAFSFNSKPWGGDIVPSKRLKEIWTLVPPFVKYAQQRNSDHPHDSSCPINIIRGTAPAADHACLNPDSGSRHSMHEHSHTSPKASFLASLSSS
jgi:hypothetical protein